VFRIAVLRVAVLRIAVLRIAVLRIACGGMPCCGCSGLLIAHCRFLIANRQLKDPPVSSNRQLAIGNRQ
jgi:hypothetical protein